MDSGESGSDDKPTASPDLLQEFARNLRIGAGKRFGPGTDGQISARVLDFFKIAPGKSPSRDTFVKWWNAEALPPWQQAVQLAILLDEYGDWLIFPDKILPPQPDLARAFFLASAKTRKVPSNTNILSWIHDHIKSQGQSVTRMSLANWVTGQTIPNAKYRPILEDLLGMRRGDLENPGGYLFKIDPKRFRPVRAAKAERSIFASPAPSTPARAKATPVVARKRIRNRPAPPSTSAIGAILDKALAELPGIPEDPKRQRSFLQKELMNRYILDVSLMQIGRWLNGYDLPEPEQIAAICELLRIENLAEQDAYKVALREAVRPAPVASTTKATETPQAVAKPPRKAAAPAKPAKSAALPRAKKETAVPRASKVEAPAVTQEEAKASPRARKAPVDRRRLVSVQNGKGPVALMIRKQRKDIPDFPKKGSDQVHFLKTLLREQGGIRVSVVDIRKWLKGSVIPEPDVLSAISDILQAKSQAAAQPSPVEDPKPVRIKPVPVAQPAPVEQPQERVARRYESRLTRQLKQEWLKVGEMIRDSLGRVPGLPNDGDPEALLMEQGKFIKSELAARFGIRIKIGDVKEWVEGTFAPNGRTLAALAEILDAPKLAGMLGDA